MHHNLQKKYSKYKLHTAIFLFHALRAMLKQQQKCFKNFYKINIANLIVTDKRIIEPRSFSDFSNQQTPYHTVIFNV
jgi:hypothetical protein